MAIQNFNEDLNIISKLGNNPNSDDNLSDAGLKGKFDAAGLLIQKFLNNVLIPAVNRIENAVGFKGTHGELSGRDAANQHPMSAIAGLVEAIQNANNASASAMGVAVAKTSTVTETVTLFADSWKEDNTMAVVIATIPSTAKAIVVSPDTGNKNYAIYADCGVRCVSQGSDGLTFRCEDVPDIDLVVNLVGFV
jgi:hypothetical protein